MTRGVRALDRVLATVLGLVLLAVGVAAVMWWTGTLADLWPGTPTTLQTGTGGWTSRPWWGAAATAAGALLVVLGLWWLLSHLRSRRSAVVRLAGSDGSGVLTLEPDAVCRHVASLVGRLPAVNGARVRLEADPAPHVLVGRMDVDPDADLAAVGEGTRALLLTAQDVLGLPDLRARVRVAVRRTSHGPRVR